MARIVGLCPGSRTITGCADDDPLGRVVLGVGFCVDVLDRGCALGADRDNCGGDGRLVAGAVRVLVATAFAGVALNVVELVEPRSEALVGLGPFVDREEPQAPAIMTTTRAIAGPTTRRRGGVAGERDARITWPR